MRKYDREYSREYNALLKAVGLCIDKCGTEATRGLRCDRHANANLNRTQARRARCVAEKFCADCGRRPPRSVKKACAQCAARANKRNRLRREHARAAWQNLLAEYRRGTLSP